MAKDTNQGEILFRLVHKKRGVSKKEVSKALDINPASLSRLFKSKVLTDKIKRRAASFFEVDESVFEINLPSLDDFATEELKNEVVMFEKLEISDVELQRIIEENERLNEENLKLRKKLDALLALIAK